MASSRDSNRLSAKLAKACSVTGSVMGGAGLQAQPGPDNRLVDAPPGLYTRRLIARAGRNRSLEGAGVGDERQDPPGLPQDHRVDDGRYVLRDEVDMGQGRRADAPRYRPQDPCGMDRRAPEHRP